MSERVWDMGDPEPVDVLAVDDMSCDDYDADSGRWGRTASGWKGYKNGGKVYLGWDELVRRWGPVREVPLSAGGDTDG